MLLIWKFISSGHALRSSKSFRSHPESRILMLSSRRAHAGRAWRRGAKRRSLVATRPPRSREARRLTSTVVQALRDYCGACCGTARRTCAKATRPAGILPHAGGGTLHPTNFLPVPERVSAATADPWLHHHASTLRKLMTGQEECSVIVLVVDVRHQREHHASASRREAADAGCC